MSARNRIFLTDLDAAHLRGIARRLLDQRGDAQAQGEKLFELLDEAEVIPAESVSPDVVTMNSTVAIDNDGDGPIETVTLVYPEHADARRRRVSVLSPLGRTLIGVRAGERVSFTTPAASVRSVRVREIVYQPEASGDWPR
jgi:regulator of nucleoside diphosphate kinase